jgi:type III pantothenate kinase
MILLVDAGNSRIKWRIVDALRRVASGVVDSVDALQLEAAWRPYTPMQALLSCVATDSVRDNLAGMLDRSGIAAHWLLAERERYGVLNLYDIPEQLGSDRYAALIAVQKLKLGECVVASIGTATTVDRLDAAGVFRGGIILPGPDMMRMALLGGTGQIAPRYAATPLSLESSGRLASPPRSTAAAVTAGIGLAQAGAIQVFCNVGLEADHEADHEARRKPPLLVLSGGARAQVRDWLALELIEIDDLVLEGLAWVAREWPCAG